MKDIFIISVQFSGSILAAVLAAGQLAVKNKNSSNYFYAFTFVSISVWSGIYAFTDNFAVSSGSDLIFIFNIASKTAYSLTAVLLYLLLQSIFSPGYRPEGMTLLLFVPAVITPVILISGRVLSAGSYGIIHSTLTTVLYIFSICIYICIMLQLNRLRQAADKRNRKSIVKVIVFLSVAAIITIIPQVTNSGIKDRFSVTSMIILFYIVTMRYPEIFIMLMEEAGKARYAKSKITMLDVETVKSRLDSLVAEEKLYLKNDLTLKEVAGLAGITPHQLSEIINVYYNRNFYDFINRFRIEEAKRILASDKSATAIAVCYEAGFNSNSAFYRAFLKETGLSPAKYRKSLSGKQFT